MSFLSYKGQFLYLFLIEREISFMKNINNEYIVHDYKVLFSPFKNNKNLKSSFKDFNYIYCENGVLHSEILFNTIGEFTNKYDVFVL